MLRKRVAIGGVVLLGLSHASTGAAFCRTTTCESCTAPPGGCVTDGYPLFWPAGCVTYDLQQDASKATTADLATATPIADAAFHAWDQVVCPDSGSKVSIQLVNGGPVECAKHEYNNEQDSFGGNANIIIFRDDDWTATQDTHTLALTTVTYNTNTGEIYDADIEVNSHIQVAGMRSISTDTPVPPNMFDLQSILTHEAGHFLGLAHTNEPCAGDGTCATMDAMYRTGSDDFRTLADDDIAGICTVYPAARAIADDSCGPRHGFSGECGTAGHKGCCSTAPGGASSRAAEGLFVWFALAGLAMARARRTSV